VANVRTKFNFYILSCAIFGEEMYGEISDHQQSWGYEDGPWKGPGHLCWWPLIFKKNF